MPSGLVALLEDIAGLTKLAAASLDDIGAAAGKAGSKAVGVVVDDTAVTPRYVVGLKPERELPIIWRIAKGSLRNKLLILLPAALLLSAFAPWAITPLLMLGGAYLCFEGAEKVIEAFTGGHRDETEDLALDGAGLAAVLVAVAPMDWPAGAPPTLTGRLHAAAAIGFFLLVAYVCVFRSGDTLRLLRDEARAAAFRATYRLLGVLMVGLPLTVWAVHVAAPGREDSPVLFLVEAAGVYVFAAFWWIKSREIAAIERQ